MYSGTYQKIESQRSLLLRLHGSHGVNILTMPTFELFDEPYKLALRVLCAPADDLAASRQLGVHLETVKQVRSALGI
jgi:hypothetical protein